MAARDHKLLVRLGRALVYKPFFMPSLLLASPFVEAAFPQALAGLIELSGPLATEASAPGGWLNNHGKKRPQPDRYARREISYCPREDCRAPGNGFIGARHLAQQPPAAPA
jgi:hypothetical protein